MSSEMDSSRNDGSSSVLRLFQPMQWWMLRAVAGLTTVAVFHDSNRLTAQLGQLADDRNMESRRA